MSFLMLWTLFDKTVYHTKGLHDNHLARATDILLLLEYEYQYCISPEDFKINGVAVHGAYLENFILSFVNQLQSFHKFFSSDQYIL